MTVNDTAMLNLKMKTSIKLSDAELMSRLKLHYIGIGTLI